MSLSHAARALWSRASVWRYAVIFAAVTTVLGLMSMSPTGGGGVSTATQGAGPGTSAASGTCPAGQQFDPVTGHCAPRTQTGTAGNCPPGGAPSQSLPGNVVVVAQQGVSPATLARITAFESRADAANAEPRQGERCDLLAAALEELEPADLAALRCEPAAMKKHSHAIQCQTDILASDRRLDGLVAAFESYGEDRSAVVVEHLARRWAMLTPFDRSRERHNALSEAVRAGETASTRIKESDARIAALENAEKTAAAAVPEDGSAIDAFGTAANTISAFDANRMNAAAARSLEAGRAAADQVAQSNSRLVSIGPAMSIAEASASAEQRQGLIDAVAALTPFDFARADEAQRDAIGQARTLALKLAQQDLVKTATGLDIAAAPPDKHQQLSNLRSVIEAHGGLAPESAPDVTNAYRIAALATASLAESDRRIANMRAVADSWQRNPGPKLENEVMNAHDSITEYDQARFDPEASRDFDLVREARNILEAMHTGLKSSTRDAAPVFVAPAGSEPRAALAVSKLRTVLVREGYRVVDSREESALTLELSWGGEDRRHLSIGSSQVETSVVTLSLVGGWTYRDEAFLRETVQGEGRAFSAAEVTEKAIDNAVTRLVAALNARAEQ